MMQTQGGAHLRLAGFLLSKISEACTTVDVPLGYDFGEEAGWSCLSGVKLNLNVTNLLDEDPPFVNSTSGFDPSKASPYGRLIAASLTEVL
jgi:iron complex outermembrane recepter protein